MSADGRRSGECSRGVSPVKSPSAEAPKSTKESVARLFAAGLLLLLRGCKDVLVSRFDLPSSTSHKVRIIFCFRPGRCHGDKAEHEDHAGRLPEIDQLRNALGHLGQDVAQVPANSSPPADIFVGHRTGVHAARSDRDEEAALHGFVHIG